VKNQKTTTIRQQQEDSQRGPVSEINQEKRTSNVNLNRGHHQKSPVREQPAEENLKGQPIEDTIRGQLSEHKQDREIRGNSP
jgi:hypothetical protein